MKNTAILFPGQGSQYVGMGQKLYELYPLAREMYEEASSIAGFDLLGRALEDPSQEILQTEFAQPAIMALSVIAYHVLKSQQDIKPQWMAGHSLGEYAALVCAGAINFNDAIRIVKKRAELMSRDIKEKCGMVAVLGVTSKQVNDWIQDYNDVYISNYNSFNQTVIAGKMDDLQKVLHVFKAKQIDARLLKLNLPFHTPLMEDTTEQFQMIIDQCEISLPGIPVISNVTARPYQSVEEIRKLLPIQISRPVQWTQTMEFLTNEGANQVLEVGPKRVLSNFFQETFPSIPCHPTEWDFDGYCAKNEKAVKKAISALASTKNNNAENAESALRINEINQELKNGKSRLDQIKVLDLLKEALELKKLSGSEVHSYLSNIKEEIQLFCLPYAGGDVSIFKDWEENLRESFHVIPLEYPGRGKKSKISLASDLERLLDDLMIDIVPKLKGPFAFFGHSLGAVVAFELAHRLKKRGFRPRFLALSACPGPQYIHKFSGTRELSDQKFIAKIQSLNGTPENLLDHESFLTYFLPILRLDFALLEDYHNFHECVLDCPVLLFRGVQDHNLTAEEINSWSDKFSKESTLIEVLGDHFFIKNPAPIFSALNRLARRNCYAGF